MRRASVLAFVLLLVAACGSSGSSASAPPATLACPAALRTEPQFVLTAAALLSLTIIVENTHASTPGCIAVNVNDRQRPVRVSIGDRVTFEANFPPQLNASEAKVVSVASSPRQKTQAVGLGHVAVVLTAIGPGTVTISYTDCSGTGC